MKEDFKKEFNFTTDLLEVVENLNNSKNLPHLIYFERTGNQLAYSEESGNIYGYLKNRVLYLRPEFIVRSENINIAISIDHLKHLIYGTAAEWLFGRLHPELVPDGANLGSWNFNRKPEDINKADFRTIDGRPVEFKSQNPEKITESLNGPSGLKFWTYFCHKAVLIYTWHAGREYRIEFNGLKWAYTETLIIPEVIWLDLQKLSLRLNKIVPDLVYKLNKDFFEDLPGLSKPEEEKINNYLASLQGEEDGKQIDTL